MQSHDPYAGHAGSRTLDEQGDLIDSQAPTADPARDEQGRLICAPGTSIEPQPDDDEPGIATPSDAAGSL